MDRSFIKPWHLLKRTPVIPFHPHNLWSIRSLPHTGCFPVPLWANSSFFRVCFFPPTLMTSCLLPAGPRGLLSKHLAVLICCTHFSRTCNKAFKKKTSGQRFLFIFSSQRLSQLPFFVSFGKIRSTKNNLQPQRRVDTDQIRGTQHSRFFISILI